MILFSFFPRWLNLSSTLLPLGHTRKPVDKHRGSDVECNVHPHKPKVPPRIAVRCMDLGQKAIRLIDAAEFAVARGIFDLQVPAITVDVVLHVGLAGHVRGWVEAQELNFLADSVVSGYTGGQHCGDEVCEWGDAVHEDPEAGNVDAVQYAQVVLEEEEWRVSVNEEKKREKKEEERGK